MPTPHDRAWADYSQQFRTTIVPQLLSSSIMLAIFDGSAEPPIQAATEIGLMLLLGKPLLVVHPPGVPLPAGLARAADEIVEADPTTDLGQVALTAAIGRMNARLDHQEA